MKRSSDESEKRRGTKSTERNSAETDDVTLPDLAIRGAGTPNRATIEIEDKIKRCAGWSSSNAVCTRSNVIFKVEPSDTGTRANEIETETTNASTTNASTTNASTTNASIVKERDERIRLQRARNLHHDSCGPSVNLSESTTTEIDALPRDFPIVIPFAAIEQHGPHLPIGTDTMITEGLLSRAAQRDPNAFLALPVQRFGSSPHHMPFAGTTTLGSRTFLDVAGDLVRSVSNHGFTRVVLFNGHGGNQALLNVAVQEARLASPELRIVHLTYWNAAADAFDRIRETPRGGMGHAGEMETSVMLAFHPELVKIDRLAPDGRWGRCALDMSDMLDGGSVGQFRFWPEMSDTGVLGDPRTASSEKGHRFVDAAVDGLFEVLRELSEGHLG